VTPPDPIYRRPDDLRFRVLDGEAVVLLQRSAEALGLDAVGSRILELCDGTRPLSAIVDLLEAEFDVERERLAADVERFAGELVEAGLLEPADPGMAGAP